jgi:PPM family protein phosphatase
MKTPMWHDVMMASRVVCSSRVEEARHGRGEDRIASIAGDDHTIFVVADGAGGVSGGAAAADAICDALKTRSSGTVDWASWLTRCDRTMATSGSSGLAAAAVIAVSDDGVISGASVGDCEAWVFGQGTPIDLTGGQNRKPMLGSGDAVPVGFTARLSVGTLLVGSDGLWKYTSHALIAEKAVMRPMESATTALIDGVRLRSGGLQDDVAVMICTMKDGA